ncbi:2'-5' RNA ligase family protein [Ectobacillus antri]|uniref:2'-5' RNA ligase family protein n=1 Tax=Ectobacillus antri TaxID=2486280 RepID=A0ABT6H1X7_9BACI|nr:2'-5' RNA ligase family protein [Ectobacillus antri]MDG4656320.1 2'-5' RNA ligase family protein [Ectobacillus antri]MDG5752995.1 2'-5' RNA ligase family protein [Ectobacillus antri]
MYAIIALFEEETHQQVIRIWNELADLRISHYAQEIENRQPHITLASYDKLEEISFIERMDMCYQATQRIPITLCTIGTFISSGALFWAPAPTKELLDFHERHHDLLSGFAAEGPSLYEPGCWVPHCTIANRLTADKLAEAVLYCTNKLPVQNAFLTKLALIRTEKANGKIVAAPIIQEWSLKERA